MITLTFKKLAKYLLWGTIIYSNEKLKIRSLWKKCVISICFSSMAIAVNSVFVSKTHTSMYINVYLILLCAHQKVCQKLKNKKNSVRWPTTHAKVAIIVVNTD